MIRTRHLDQERDGPDEEKKYLGEYLGFVRDSADPEQRGRVRAYCPEVMGEVDAEETWLDWAEAKHFMAGFDQGFMCVPPDPTWLTRDPGGESSPLNTTRVWITFRNGDPARPLYTPCGPWYGENELPSSVPKLITMDSGGDETTALPNSITSTVRYRTIRPEESEDAGESAGTLVEGGEVAEPPPQTTAQYPFNHIYKSPAGHVVEFDNTPASERFRLFHPAGTSIEVNQSGSYATKIQGKETRFIVEDSTRVVKGGLTDVVEGTRFLQVNRSSEEIYRDSRLQVVERKYESYYKGGWSITVGGQMDVSCANFDVESVGTVTLIAGSSISASADSIEIGGQSAELSSNNTLIKSITGVKLSVGLEALAVHPIYASTLINTALSTLSATLSAATGTAIPALPTATVPPAPVLNSAALGTWMTAVTTAISAIAAAFNANLTTHKVSFP